MSNENHIDLVLDLYKQHILHAGEVHSLNMIDGCRSLDILVFWVTIDQTTRMLMHCYGAKQTAHEEEAITQHCEELYSKLIKLGIIKEGN